jgi:hypothetical protein
MRTRSPVAKPLAISGGILKAVCICMEVVVAGVKQRDWVHMGGELGCLRGKKLRSAVAENPRSSSLGQFAKQIEQHHFSDGPGGGVGNPGICDDDRQALRARDGDIDPVTSMYLSLGLAENTGPSEYASISRNRARARR